MKKSEKTLRMLSGALLFACGLAALAWRSATEHTEVSLVWIIILLAVGSVLFASAEKRNKQ